MENKLSLSDASSEIHRLHKLFLFKRKGAVELCEDAFHTKINIGKVLVRVRRVCRHGSWMKWVADNCPFSFDTADNYIQAALNPNALSFKTLKDLYIAERIQPKPPAQRTCGATVDIYEEAALRVTKEMDSIYSIRDDAPFSEWPEAKLSTVRERLEPLVRELWPNGMEA